MGEKPMTSVNAMGSRVSLWSIEGLALFITELHIRDCKGYKIFVALRLGAP